MRLILRVSVIDLGFNSLKFVSYDVRDDNSFSVYEQRSFAARLGEGLNKTGSLRQAAIRRTIEGLKVFREVTNSESIKHVLPIATSAVREANNKEQFLKQVYEETGFKFRVLSAREEASYSCAGASRSMLQSDVLFFDLGGGSLEIVHTLNFSMKEIFSLPLGALKLTQIYANSNGSFPKKNYSKLRKYVLDLLPDREQLNIKDKTMLIGVGGSLRAIASYDQELNNYPLYKVHGYQMNKESVDSIRTGLAKSDLNKISEIDWIGKDRAKTITAGATVIDLIMEKLDFKKLIVSTEGLRDGILAAYLAGPAAYQRGDPVAGSKLTRPKQDDPLEYSRVFVSWLVSQKLIDKEEAEILSYATRQMLRKLPLYRPTPLFHILMDEDSNLTHSAQLIMALSIVRTIRPKAMDWLYERYKSILEPGSKNSSKRISILVGLTTLLEKTHSTIKSHWRNNNMMVEIFPERGAYKMFPYEMLKLAMFELSNAFDLSVKFSVNGSKLRAGSIKVEEA